MKHQTQAKSKTDTTARQQNSLGANAASIAPPSYGMDFLDSQARQPNRTGLPDNLKSGIENLSGLSMDSVRVHYNSPKPAQLNALAYTQGTDIHVAPGQEQHLPHEAWHVVQQAEGRVKPMFQMKTGIPVNDDSGLEAEADKMGTKALTNTAQFSGKPKPSRVTESSVVQMIQYLWKNGRIYAVSNEYKKKKGEKWSNLKEYIEKKGSIRATKKEEIELIEQELKTELEGERIKQEALLQEALRQEALRKKELRRQKKEARRKTLFQKHKPQNIEKKQMSAPEVEGTNLYFRGMSVNNVRNLTKGKEVIFNAQNPEGKASPEQHIVDDDKDSPYLSFETEGLKISAGKYAPKPVDPKTKKPLDVKEEKGFLKQEKSYAKKSKQKHPDAKRIGYVGGIIPPVGTLDFSTKEKANALKSPKAQSLAIADKEVLVKPGIGGIKKDQVPFVAKVQEVPEDYYIKNIGNQTEKNALGYYKSTKGKPVYYKIQIASEHSDKSYKFNIPLELKREEDDSDSEMSDIESMEFSDWD